MHAISETLGDRFCHIWQTALHVQDVEMLLLEIRIFSFTAMLWTAFEKKNRK